jgi:hypothetical protein
MDNERLIEILKKNAIKHPNDSRQIIDYKDNVMYGNQIGAVLSNVDNKVFEVFIHAKINNEVISQLLYKSFTNIEEAKKQYNKYEKYIIDFDMNSIINDIEKEL